jgi:uncharacterized membrane-anchored protein
VEATRLAKVPEVTLGFWLIKIFATTLGETGGDALSMTLNLGYLLSTAIFGVLFLALVGWQIRGEGFHPLRYWATIIATTTVGTTLADFADRSIGIGYTGGSALLLALVLASLWGWHRSEGRIDPASVATPRAEAWYWLTILFSQTLGTALGDWTADSAGLGYVGAGAIFGALLLAIAAAHRWTRLSATALFWAAFVLTRPLGAVVGDFLDKPLDHGGLALGRFAASGVLLVVIALCVWRIPQRPAQEAH